MATFLNRTDPWIESTFLYAASFDPDIYHREVVRDGGGGGLLLAGGGAGRAGGGGGGSNDNDDDDDKEEEEAHGSGTEDTTIPPASCHRNLVPTTYPPRPCPDDRSSPR